MKGSTTTSSPTTRWGIARAARSGERLRAGPLPPADAAWVVHALARIVEQAHERGVLHRGIKPENVLFEALVREQPEDDAARRFLPQGR